MVFTFFRCFYEQYHYNIIMYFVFNYVHNNYKTKTQHFLDVIIRCYCNYKMLNIFVVTSRYIIYLSSILHVLSLVIQYYLSINRFV